MVDGVPTYTDNITHNSDGIPMNEMISQYAMPSGYPTLQSVDYFDQYMQSRQKAAIGVWRNADKSRSIPSLRFSSEESKNVNQKYNEIKSYHDEIINKFIVGKEPLDNFGKYVQTVQSMGIKDVVASYQSAYERYTTRVGK